MFGNVIQIPYFTYYFVLMIIIEMILNYAVAKISLLCNTHCFILSVCLNYKILCNEAKPKIKSDIL